MIEKTATIRNAAGIHCRPSVEIVAAVSGYEGQIAVSRNGRTTDLRAMHELVMLGLLRGDEVRVAVSGPDEEAVCLQVVDLFEKEFNFAPGRDRRQDRRVN
jgi:phosphocarrier protein